MLFRSVLAPLVFGSRGTPPGPETRGVMMSHWSMVWMPSPFGISAMDISLPDVIIEKVLDIGVAALWLSETEAKWGPILIDMLCEIVDGVKGGSGRDMVVSAEWKADASSSATGRGEERKP